MWDHRQIGKPSRQQLRLRPARTCYDHLAGQLGVAIADYLHRSGYVIMEGTAARVTDRGWEFFSALGINIAAVRARKTKPACKTCMDWTEGKPHIGGALGAAISACFFDNVWIERFDDSRAIGVTAEGRAMLRKWKIDVDRIAARPGSAQQSVCE